MKTAGQWLDELEGKRDEVFELRRKVDDLRNIIKAREAEIERLRQMYREATDTRPRIQ